MPTFYPQMHTGLEDEVFLTQTEEISSIAALWCRRETEEELGCEVIHDASIGARRRMMKFIDDDIVESVRPKFPDLVHLAEGLNGGEQEIGLRVLVIARKSSDPSRRPHAPECLDRLLRISSR